MPYSTQLNGRNILVPDLVADGRNWSDYKKKLVHVAKLLGILRLLDGTEVRPMDQWNPWIQAAWVCNDTEAQYLLVTTTPPFIHNLFKHGQPVHKWFSHLQTQFDKLTTTTKSMVQCRNKCIAMQSTKWSETVPT